MNVKIGAAVVLGAGLVWACGSGKGGTGTVSTALEGGAGQDVCASEFASSPPTAMQFSAGVSSTSPDGSAKVAIDSTPAVPSLGDHSTWKLTVTDATGSPVPAGTKVKVVCVMTHSGFSHGCPATISVKEMGGGVYEASPVIFNMQGHWHIDIGVDLATTEDVPFEFCIE